MVPNFIVMQVPMVLAPIQARYSKEKECQDRWAGKEITIQNLGSSKS